MATDSKPLRLQLKYGAKRIRQEVEVTMTLVELKTIVAQQLGVPADRQRLLKGFPPSTIAGSDNQLLVDIGVCTGESLIVEDDETAMRGIAKSSNTSVLSAAPFTIDGRGYMVRRQMPADNSCLFHSINYTCNDRRTGKDAARQLRVTIAEVVKAQSHIYTAAVLGQSTASYTAWVLDDNTWGGAIELRIFSDLMQTEIIAFDLQYLREDIFGEGNNYPRVVFLIYTGKHYDTIVYSPYGGAPEGNDKVVFSTKDQRARQKAREHVEHLHREVVKENPSLKLQKQWRRTISGDEQKSSQGYRLGAESGANGGSTTQKGNQWACRSCTFLNSEFMQSCEMCNAPRT